jgi:molybdate/tungstate transport system ATP-binding protein
MTQPAIAVEGLSLALGEFRLSKLDFALSKCEVLVILGPNGSGKSVTLETIAGFHRPDAGRVLIAGRDVTALPPERRNVAFLVQNFGLFPHLTVAQNVAIALRRARLGDGAAAGGLPAGDVAKLLAHFEVAHLAERTPQALSPGEKQRVALARALAAKPDLFLFDEPFSALDAHTRDQLREELLAFLRRLSLPAIFVTHDHSDALTLADKILVLRNGETMQAGSAHEIFHKPANLFVARFVGVENILAVRLDDGRGDFATVAIGGQRLRAAAPVRAPDPARPIHASLRAEAVTLDFSGSAPAPDPAINRIEARVTALRIMGPLATVELDCGFPLKAYALAQQARVMGIAPGRAVTAEIAAQSIHLLWD